MQGKGVCSNPPPQPNLNPAIDMQGEEIVPAILTHIPRGMPEGNCKACYASCIHILTPNRLVEPPNISPMNPVVKTPFILVLPGKSSFKKNLKGEFLNH